MENYGVANNLSTHAKFHDARFQSPLLIMSKIFAEIPFVGKKTVIFLFNAANNWKFWWGHFRNKTRLATNYL